ncbi:transmembrane protein 26 [Drosophila pseudoobscura]|uniref:Transmembrane protein 26 n=1 Tax=Drosophila pseudoobscura pseudoobscura TaxID=46245 RepID=A0A6I8UN89_DROPS|nr:transmembrane protein 26 [Drosophila pseudoobscura]
MAKIISTIKAILTRIIFSAHSLLAIWQVTTFKDDIIYWTLCGPLLLLLLEGIFTIMIKKTQEWRWFCPSVFLYLSSIVPAIWLLELDKIERRLQIINASLTSSNATSPNPNNFSSPSSSLISGPSGSSNSSGMDPVADLLDDAGIKLPVISADTWTTLIEQFLMLILIVGRWLLPKGDLTRDQLSQLLLVYIGTAADIIEFFDSYKDDSIARIGFLVYLTLGIWSWSLMQFTIVLSATRGRRPRGSGSHQKEEHTDCCQNCCCGIDVWGIVLNVILQDAPFLTFRLLIIFQYKIINYMNVFFTCKNSLVIILQLYRLYVVNAEFWKSRRESRMAKSRQFQSRRRVQDADQNSIYMISNERGGDVKKKIKKAKDKDYAIQEASYSKKKKDKKDKKKRKHKDTGYSTASSQNLYSTKASGTEKDPRRKDKKGKKSKRICSSSPSDCDLANAKKQKRAKNADKNDKKKNRKIEVIEESNSSSSSSSSDSSNSTLPSYEVIDEKKAKARRRKQRGGSSSDSSSSESSSESSSSSSSSSS